MKDNYFNILSGGDENKLIFYKNLFDLVVKESHNKKVWKQDSSNSNISFYSHQSKLNNSTLNESQIDKTNDNKSPNNKDNKDLSFKVSSIKIEKAPKKPIGNL